MSERQEALRVARAVIEAVRSDEVSLFDEICDLVKHSDDASEFMHSVFVAFQMLVENADSLTDA